MQLTGSEIVVECLKEQGVDTVFGYPGRQRPMRQTDMPGLPAERESVWPPAAPAQPIW